MSNKDLQPPKWDLTHDAEVDSEIATVAEKKVDKPRLYKVLLHNDDYTTMEFVVMVLKGVFHHSEEKAIEIMLNVHNSGTGVAGIYTYEVAETKAAKVLNLARTHEFPLRCSLEPA